jgi:hypothetical protein
MPRTSRADRRLLTAVKIARHLAAPYMTSTNSGPLAPMKATRSPGSTPVRRRARATWLDRRSSSANEVSRPASASAIGAGVIAARFLMMSASEYTGEPSGWYDQGSLSVMTCPSLAAARTLR